MKLLLLYTMSIGGLTLGEVNKNSSAGADHLAPTIVVSPSTKEATTGQDLDLLLGSVAENSITGVTISAKEEKGQERSRGVRARRPGSTQSNTMDASFDREPPVQNPDQHPHFVPKESVHKTEGESEGLLAEYGLIFLISAGSLSIVAASLLGLSIAWRSDSNKTGKASWFSAEKKFKFKNEDKSNMPPQVPCPGQVMVEREKYSFRALADSFVGSIRSFANPDPAPAPFNDSKIENAPTLDASDKHAEDSAWSMYHTEEGIPYYYNALTGKTSWEPPKNVVLAESFTSTSSYYSSTPRTLPSNSALP
uniref:WW domain-containing protein n=1 Tax=Amorphochlora amoebiformis TaxID=1561963 RepID=A0A7S0CZY2_9EUKA|mmetsp:Transcript_15351/g.24298  ORF Transcript_15351/g.24298 Transcript_15351/m.24298 type:complete len:308 (+) Transcript_15351:274-1197(+)